MIKRLLGLGLSLGLLISCQKNAPKSSAPLFKLPAIDSNGLLIPWKKGERCGYLNRQGQIIRDISQGYCAPFSGGLAAVVENGKLGYIDTTGKWAIEPIFDYDTPRRTSGTEGWVNDTLQIARDLDSRSWHEGRAFVSYQGQKGFVNLQGVFTPIPGLLESYGYNQGFAPVRDSLGWSLIDTSGQTRTTEPFEAMGLPSQGLISVQQNKLWGWIDFQGHWVQKPKYSWVYDASDSILLVQDSLFHYIHLHTQKQSLALSEAYPFDCGVAVAKQKDQYGLLNSSLEWKSFAWTDAYPGRSCRIVARDEQGYHIYNTQGQILDSITFDRGFSLNAGFAIAEISGKKVLVDSSAKILWREP